MKPKGVSLSVRTMRERTNREVPMRSKLKLKHKFKGNFGEWVDLTCDCMFKYPRIKGDVKRVYRKKLRLRMKRDKFG